MLCSVIKFMVSEKATKISLLVLTLLRSVNLESNLWFVNFSQKRTDEFVLFAFLLFTGN